MATRRKTSRPSPFVNLAIAVAVIGGIGLMGYAAANTFGLIGETATKQVSREGKVPLPRSLVDLKAYEEVSREHIYDREIGDESYFWLPKAQVEANPDWIRSVDDVVGRVMARDKGKDFVFRERDFLPEGSRTGLSAGVPEGKQGFFLDAANVPGLRLLKMGDRFDLMASLPEETAKAESEYGLLVGGIKARAGKPIPLTGVRLLVQGGTIIALTNGKQVTTQGAMGLPPSDPRGRGGGKEQIAIAIDPEEVVPLTQALGSKQTIHAVARSGQADKTVPARDELAGLIPFPGVASPIEAYSRVQASDFAEPLTGELRQYYFRPDAANPDWIASVEDMLGKVVRFDVEPGYIFTTADFLPPDALVRDVKAFAQLSADDLANPLSSTFVGRVAARDLEAGRQILETDVKPPGSLPGITSGIPAGRLAISIGRNRVDGLDQLQQGNRCDLVASVPFDIAKELGRSVRFAARGGGLLEERVVNTVLASNAIVVSIDDAEVTLAVTSVEVSRITKALALSHPVYTVAKPMLPASMSPESATADEPAVSLESDPNPLANIAITEMIIDGKRTVSAYRKQVGDTRD